MENTCISCHEAPAEGKWELCPACRSQLATDHANRLARRPRSSRCMSCFFGRPVDGTPYCHRCLNRFNFSRDRGGHGR